MSKIIYSFHTPKTGGLPLEENWKRIFGDDCVRSFYLFEVLSLTDGMVFKSIPPEPIEDCIKVVHGHFCLHDYWSNNGFWMTFLRHPVENTLLMYAMLVAIEHDKPEVSRKTISYKDFVQMSSIRNFYSQHLFGGLDMPRFDFIGDYAHMDDELDRLGSMLGLEFDNGVRKHATAELNNCPDAYRIRKGELLERVNQEPFTSILSKDIDFYNKHKGR